MQIYLKCKLLINLAEKEHILKITAPASQTSNAWLTFSTRVAIPSIICKLIDMKSHSLNRLVLFAFRISCSISPGVIPIIESIGGIPWLCLALPCSVFHHSPSVLHFYVEDIGHGRRNASREQHEGLVEQEYFPYSVQRLAVQEGHPHVYWNQERDWKHELLDQVPDVVEGVAHNSVDRVNIEVFRKALWIKLGSRGLGVVIEETIP